MALGSAFDTTLAAARTGADWAWRELYLDLAPTLLGYLRKLGARDAEDLLGEVFLRIVRRLESFDGDEAGFRSWVFMIAHNLVIDARRYDARRPADPSPAEDLEAAMPAPDVSADVEAVENVTTEEITRLLDVLTDDQREVLVLRLAGFTISEVAGIIDRNENATKALQRRGIRSLERHLERTGDPYPSSPPARSQR